MLGNFHVRTDLALEARESFEEDDVKIRGVRVETREDEEKEIRTTLVKIETENGDFLCYHRMEKNRVVSL